MNNSRYFHEFANVFIYLFTKSINSSCLPEANREVCAGESEKYSKITTVGHSIVSVGIKSSPREGNIFWSEKDEIKQNHALSLKKHIVGLKVLMQAHKATQK